MSVPGAWRQIIPAFLIGCLLGGFAGARCQKMAFHRFWQYGPDTDRIMRKFDRELDLDAKQQEAVKALLEKKRGKIRALHQESSARFKQIRADMRADIRKLLNPEQQKKFEAMAARWDARHKNRWEDSK